MEPATIETKRLRMVGVEMYVNLKENFTNRISAMRAEIRARLDEIQLKKGNKHIGFWQQQFIPEEGLTLHRNYFCGVEVSDFEEILYGMTTKNLPQCIFAVFLEKNGEEGTITEKNDFYNNWLPKSKYTFCRTIFGDFEVYDFDQTTEYHEVWIPLGEKQ